MQKSDFLDKPWKTNGCTDAYNRVIGILYDIVEEDPVNRPRSIADSNQDQLEEISDLLSRLDSSTYLNGSTHVSRLFLLWSRHFYYNSAYDEVCGILIEIANNQEWFDPRDDLAEALESLQIG